MECPLKRKDRYIPIIFKYNICKREVLSGPPAHTPNRIEVLSIQVEKVYLFCSVVINNIASIILYENIRRNANNRNVAVTL